MEQSSTTNEWSNRSSSPNFISDEQSKDPQLWDIAKRRASFKSHFATYLIISAFFWALWYFTGGRDFNSGIPWPIWPMLGWGIGVLFHYMGAYVNPKANAVDKEYEKLLRENKRRH